MRETDLDALLLHRDFVRDPHLAADAEQDTWVAALRGGPDDAGAVRAWLGAVVRNFARKQARGTGRRRAREQAVATPDASEDLVLAGGDKVAAGTTGLELVGEPGNALTGRVVDGEGKAVAGARVTVMPHGSRDERITTSKADGTFRIQGLVRASEWRLFASTDDGRRGRISHLVAGTKGIRVGVR